MSLILFVMNHLDYTQCLYILANSILSRMDKNILELRSFQKKIDNCIASLTTLEQRMDKLRHKLFVCYDKEKEIKQRIDSNTRS